LNGHSFRVFRFIVFSILIYTAAKFFYNHLYFIIFDEIFFLCVIYLYYQWTLYLTLYYSLHFPYLPFLSFNPFIYNIVLNECSHVLLFLLLTFDIICINTIVVCILHLLFILIVSIVVLCFIILVLITLHLGTSKHFQWFSVVLLYAIILIVDLLKWSYTFPVTYLDPIASLIRRSWWSVVLFLFKFLRGHWLKLYLIH
jgi:hypothetical protein